MTIFEEWSESDKAYYESVKKHKCPLDFEEAMRKRDFEETEKFKNLLRAISIERIMRLRQPYIDTKNEILKKFLYRLFPFFYRKKIRQLDLMISVFDPQAEDHTNGISDMIEKYYSGVHIDFTGTIDSTDVSFSQLHQGVVIDSALLQQCPLTYDQIVTKETKHDI